jgi:hypothetical protein
VSLDATYPVALLPVRVETRFDGSLLQVRIFPDDIWANTHEPALTAQEQADGTAYLAAKAAGLGAEQAAWAALVARWTAPRAAYIAAAVAAGPTETKAESWTRAAQALLPGQWIVRAYQGSNVFTVTSSPVRRPLALTFSPTSTPADRVPLGDGLSIDAALQWTVDFGAAQAAGMAVTIDLTAPDPPAAAAGDPAVGVDLLVVVGISDNQPASDGAAQLRALLDAQHYTRGLAFLTPGTPTNNTPAGPAGFPPADPAGATSFAIERGQPLVDDTSPAGTHGVAFAHAFGLPLAAGERVAAVEHLANANGAGETAAAAMNQALWPATLGYFLEQLMAPEFDGPTIEAARQLWVNHVRPGGPLPAFRVGNVPYGILPAVSLDRLQADTRFTPALRALRDRFFVPAAASAPRLTADSADPDGDLLKVLAQDASARVLRMRILLGLELTSNTAGWLGDVAAAEEQAAQLQRALSAATLLTEANLPGQTRIGGLDGGPTYELLGGPLVTRGALSELYGLSGPDGTGVNYIQWLHDNTGSNRDAIKNDALPGTSRPLLYRLLRHALLLEMDRIAFTHLLAANVVTPADQPERELVGLTTTGAPLTAYARIDQAATDSAFVGSLSPYLSVLATLAKLPTAELDRRFGETLDACSHRLDAWITAAATTRLAALRQTNPTGSYLGGFGFVENIRPAVAAAPIGGFIHAPSPAHASAAAILRNGFLSRGGAGSTYDIDLSSARVRAALSLIDGVRQGDPLASLLGQRLERDLHTRQLELLIAPLRGYFPLVAGKTAASDGPTELVAAGNVVDGLALRQAWNTSAAPFADATDLPALTTTQLDSFHAALGALNDAIDGVTDVLTAESIFQTVRGNTTATAASLDSMAAGVLPPMPEVTRTPLASNSFTQRLAVALAPGTPPADDWGAPTVRALAEPALDHWLGTLLGSPTAIGCRVVFPDASNHDLTLDALALRPIDLVTLSRTQPTGLGDSELDQRILTAAAAPAGAHVLYDTTTVAWTLADTLELARTIGALLAIARPLTPADLVAPAYAAAAPVDQPAAGEAAARAQAAIDNLTSTAAQLEQALTATSTADPATAEQLSALRTELQQAAAYGIPGAYPGADADGPALVAVATWIKAELAKRQPASLPAPDSDPDTLLAAAAAAVQTVFGRDFLFLPRLNTPELATPLAASATLLGNSNGPQRALQQLARVRANLGRWRSLWMYARAFGAAAPPLEVVQLPTAATWAGNPGAEIASGTLSLIVHRPTQAAPAGGWVGIVVDEWTEVVPATSQGTALSFRYESPVAEPPQAILLAVPPASAASWDHDTLLDTVRETLLLAKVRTVDSSLLDELRPFLPAICLTGNTANETVSTDFLTTIVAEPGLSLH